LKNEESIPRIILSGHNIDGQVNVERHFCEKNQKIQNRLLSGVCDECSNWISASVTVGNDVGLYVVLRRGVFLLES
jgi:hypothetical protein